jgi:hypothetical protein
MVNAMGEAGPVDPYQSPPIIATPIRPIYTLPTEPVDPVAPIQSPPFRPPPRGPVSVTVNDRVYEPTPLVGYAIMGFAGYCVYAGVRDLLGMFKGRGT